MARMDQINELLREKIANATKKEVDLNNALITITDVDCSPDLKSAKVMFSVLPDNMVGSALEKLRKNTGNIARILRKEVRIRTIPKLKWVFDDTGKNVSKLDIIFEKIEKGEDIENDEPINYE